MEQVRHTVEPVTGDPRRPLILLAAALLMLPGNLPAQQANPAQLDQLSEQAQQAMAAKNWAEAASVLEKLARLAPQVAEVQANLGLAYYSQNQVAQAAQAFERAVKLNPKMARARLMLGLCDAELGHNDAAIPILEPAFRHPSDEDTGRLAGLDLERAYLALHQDDKAVAVGEELVRRFPDDPEILFQVSRLFAGRSYALMRRLLLVGPDSLWVHCANAEVNESIQRYDPAIAEYRQVLGMNPHLAEIHFKIGRCLLRKSKEPAILEAARGEFEQELAINPQSAEAEYEIGEIDRQRGQFERALPYFTRAVQNQSGFVEGEIGLARTLMAMGKQRDAKTHLETAARLDPENEVPHFLLAAVYRSMGDSANQRREMDIFQKLQAAEKRLREPALGVPAPDRVTQPTVEESSPQP